MDNYQKAQIEDLHNQVPRIKVIWKWYDLWIGIFIDNKKRFIYVFPLPTLGIRIKY